MEGESFSYSQAAACNKIIVSIKLTSHSNNREIYNDVVAVVGDWADNIYQCKPILTTQFRVASNNMQLIKLIQFQKRMTVMYLAIAWQLELPQTSCLGYRTRHESSNQPVFFTYPFSAIVSLNMHNFY